MLRVYLSFLAWQRRLFVAVGTKSTINWLMEVTKLVSIINAALDMLGYKSGQSSTDVKLDPQPTLPDQGTTTVPDNNSATPINDKPNPYDFNDSTEPTETSTPSPDPDSTPVPERQWLKRIKEAILNNLRGHK